MPKVKSRRGAVQRFKRTAPGKLVRKKAFRNHILTKKSPKRKRNLRSGDLVDPVDEPRIKTQVPYI